jgi:spore maturation protein CgeB
MRILFLNTDYSSFLAWLYRRRPLLAFCGYDEQMAARDASLFGTADFMSRPFVAQGHAAIDIHANNRLLQEAWAFSRLREVTGWIPRAASFVAPAKFRRRVVSLDARSKRFHQILATQIAEFRPTILYNHDPAGIAADWLKSVLPRDCALVAQIASPRGESTDWHLYDLVISSLPNFVAWFKAHAVNAEYMPLAFEPRVREHLGSLSPDIPLSFIGSLSPAHRERLAFLEILAGRCDMKVWGDGIDRLPAGSPIRSIHQGEAWGAEMFSLLGRSQVTLNKHIDISENFANNMRLFEATGMGSCLVTDWKDNLGELFEPDKEVLAYRSTEECLDLLKFFTAHEREAVRIAEAGHARCLAEHTYSRRMDELIALLIRNFG